MNDLQKLLRVFDAYVAATGLSDATVSARFLQRAGRIVDLRAGGDMGSRTIHAALRAFSTRWPDDAEWPLDVDRPAIAVKSDDAAPSPFTPEPAR